MAAGQVPPRETSSQPNAFVTKLGESYPQCDIRETADLKGHYLISVQPKINIDLKLDFRVSKEDSQSMSFLSLASRSFSKKDLQPLQRSLELQMAISTKRQVLTEALNLVNDFVKSEGLLEKDKTVSCKKKKKKTISVKHDGCVKANREQSDILNEKTVLKKKDKRGKGISRKLNLSDDSVAGDSSEEELTPSSIYGSALQEHTQNVVCSILPMSARPTHFMAIRVRSKSILDGLMAAQKELVSQEPLLEKGAFDPEIFHLTLLTLGLDSLKDIENCIQALETMSSSLEKTCPLQPFIIHSMSQFYNRAIFAKVKVEQDFLDFREHLRNELMSFNVEIRDMYENFNPHLTIIKVKRPERKLFGSRNIQPAIYSHLKDVVFGEQMVDEIHLCSMDGQRREDGFYTSLFEIRFNS
ncbi:leukocyte receptor cluster member 9-like [Elysia marginata]|uniref:Leukocyte receptor cluster member 9-like n=1 Tax=Elysia marginata TaxID=1093978 RepID=A0AAV4GJM6_9GAST|nr:leukocyte receptor cluster member 9-like [Elysia marginata]